MTRRECEFSSRFAENHKLQTRHQALNQLASLPAVKLRQARILVWSPVSINKNFDSYLEGKAVLSLPCHYDLTSGQFRDGQDNVLDINDELCYHNWLSRYDLLDPQADCIEALASLLSKYQGCTEDVLHSKLAIQYNKLADLLIGRKHTSRYVSDRLWREFMQARDEQSLLELNCLDVADNHDVEQHYDGSVRQFQLVELETVLSKCGNFSSQAKCARYLHHLLQMWMRTRDAYLEALDDLSLSEEQHADPQLQQRCKQTLKAWTARQVLLAIGGIAGSGKSTLMAHFFGQYSSRHVARLGPTGSAASNIGGITTFKFGCLNVDLKCSLEKGTAEARQVQNTLVLLIDEFCYSDAAIMNALNLICQLYPVMPCLEDLPFGGRIVILLGDPLQLEPVNVDTNGSFLDSKLFHKFDIAVLKENIRYDDEMLEFLTNVREEINHEQIHRFLLERQVHTVTGQYLSDFLDSISAVTLEDSTTAVIAHTTNFGDLRLDKDALMLFAYNKEVDKMNDAILKKMPGEPEVVHGKFIFQDAEVHDATRLECLKKTGKTRYPRHVTLKVGCRYIHLANTDPLHHWSNGEKLAVTRILTSLFRFTNNIPRQKSQWDVPISECTQEMPGSVQDQIVFKIQRKGRALP